MFGRATIARVRTTGSGNFRRTAKGEYLVIQTLLLLRVPAVVAELFVAAVSSWIGLNIHKTLRDPKTPPAESVLLDVRLGLWSS